MSDEWDKVKLKAEVNTLRAERDALRAELAAMTKDRDELRAAVAPVVTQTRIYHSDGNDDLILIGITFDERARIDAALKEDGEG